MPTFSVAKRITVQAPVETVQTALQRFEDWPQWSPWLIADPDAEVTVDADGKGYRWRGDLVGAGSMTLLDSPSAGTLRYDLEFIKPWKSHADVRFELKATREGTEVVWAMDSSLPIFMFWMKKLMVAMIGMDYDRGLVMLKDWLETDAVPFKLTFRGPTQVPNAAYVGIKTRCAMREIGSRMEADIAELLDWAKTSGTAGSGPLFSVYHEWSIGKGETCYTCALPVQTIPTDLPDNLTSGQRPELNTYAIAHTGPYRHLANAWSAGILRSRSKTFRQSRKHHPFEIYDKGPDQAGPLELVTTVHFPIQ